MDEKEVIKNKDNKEFILKAYNHAVEERYRFFSFGDAMLILKNDK